MIQDKTQIKEQRPGKVAKKTKSLPQKSDQKSASKTGASEGSGSASKFQIKSDKKKGAKIQKRTMSQSSQKDNIQNPAELDAQNMKNFSLDQSQLFKVTAQKHGIDMRQPEGQMVQNSSVHQAFNEGKQEETACF